MFSAIDALEFPELHDESIPAVAFQRHLGRLLAAAGVRDFSLKASRTFYVAAATSLRSKLLLAVLSPHAASLHCCWHNNGMPFCSSAPSSSACCLPGPVQAGGAVAAAMSVQPLDSSVPCQCAILVRKTAPCCRICTSPKVRACGATYLPSSILPCSGRCGSSTGSSSARAALVMYRASTGRCAAVGMVRVCTGLPLCCRRRVPCSVS